MSALDSYCHCNKLPQSSVEKQQRFFFIVLEVKVYHEAVGRVAILPEVSRNNQVPCLFHLLEEDAFLGSWALPPSSKLSGLCAQLLQLCLTFVTPWTVAHQDPLSMGFSRQEYWSGLPCPPPGVLPNPGIEPVSLTSPALAGGFFATSANWKPPKVYSFCLLWPPSSLL